MEVKTFTTDVNGIRKMNTSLVIESEFSKEIQIILPKGESMKEHKTPFPILIHVISGEIDFTVKGKTTLLSAGNITALAAHIPHHLFAHQDAIIRLTLSKNDAFQRVQQVAEG